MSKGSGRRNENTKLVEANWDKIFKKKIDPEETEPEDDYGNKLPYKIEPTDPDKYIDELGDA